MAHLQDIHKHRCGGKCGRWAICELVNDRGGVVGYYCRRCGDAALKRFEQQRADHARVWGQERAREHYGSR